MGLYKRGKTWCIQYWADGKRRREAIGPSKRQAELVLAKRKTEIREGRYFEAPKQEAERFAHLLDRWIREHAEPYREASTNRHDRSRVERFRKEFGESRIRDIRPAIISTLFATLLEEGKSPATVNRFRAVLSSVFSAGVRWRLCQKNPVSQVPALRVERKAVRFLSPDEADRLLVNCSDWLRPIVQFALHTGLRQGELLGLDWPNVNLKSRTAHILKTKSHSPRTIPLNDAALEALAALPRHLRNPYVFLKPTGQRAIRSSVRRPFYAALEASGLEGLRFHDLRHTFASNLVLAGVPLPSVKELLGHHSIEMTMRYAHLAPSHLRSAVDTLDRAMRVAPDVAR